jgi:hypothetical protein
MPTGSLHTTIPVDQSKKGMNLKNETANAPLPHPDMRARAFFTSPQRGEVAGERKRDGG